MSDTAETILNALFKGQDNRKIVRPKDVTATYVENLKSAFDAQTYLMDVRGFTQETLDHFKIGYDPSRSLIVFPAYKNGEVIDYKFRTIPPADKQFFRCPNSESYIFNEGGLKLGKEIGELTICEGEMDCMTLWQAGYQNVISGTSGARYTGEWVLDAASVQKVYICLDSDATGKEAAKKLAHQIGPDKCFNIELPEGIKDVNELLCKDKEHFKEAFDKCRAAASNFAILGVSKLYDLFGLMKSLKKDKDFKFGFDNIDDVIGGLNRGEVVMVTGHTSKFKTTFVSNLAVNFSSAGIPTVFFPLEGDTAYATNRCLTIHQGTSTEFWNDADWDTAAADIENLPLYIYTGGDTSFDEQTMERLVLGAQKVLGAEVIIIDHIHYFAETSGHEDQKDSVGRLIRKINRLAKDNHIAILVIAHVTKPPRTKADPMDYMPSMSDMRDTSFLMQDPDKVFIVHQKAGDVNAGVVRLRIDKNRYGPKISEIGFSINYDTGKFTERELVSEPVQTGTTTNPRARQGSMLPGGYKAGGWQNQEDRNV